MFGYVRPPLGEMAPEEQERFRQVYCGLCHTLGGRYGLAARFILNYDFTFLAILLSDGGEAETGCARCVAHPCSRRRYQRTDQALALAADESVILAYWQLRDGVADHGFWKGLKYRLLSALLRRSYEKAAGLRPDFDARTKAQLARLRQLEEARCASMDQAADAFADLLSAAAEELPEGARQRVLRQLLYHLGRWIYLVDAADDLKEDAAGGNYNPVALRFGLTDGVWTGEARHLFAQTLDHSVQTMAAAFELGEFGRWTSLLERMFYKGLYQVGGAVLNGTFRDAVRGKKERKARLLRKPHE